MHGKLGPRFRSVNFPRFDLCAALLLPFLITSCLLPAGTVQDVGAGDWTTDLHDAQRTPFLSEHVPAEPVIQWEQRYDRGYTDVPHISGPLILTSSPAKSVLVANAVTGRRIWERRLNGAVVGALLRRGDVVFAVTQSRDGRVDALNVERGRHVWTAKLNAPALGGALLEDSVIYTGNVRGDLFALDIRDGHRIWRTRLSAPLDATPLVFGNDLIIITAKDTLRRVDRASGRVAPGIQLPGSSSAPPALQGDRLLVAAYPGVLHAIHLPDLRVEWSATLDAPILAAPALDTNGDVYLLTRVADVWRVDPQGHATRIARLGGAASASLTLTADGLLVGKLDGSLYMLRRDGTQVWEWNFTHAVRSPVALHAGAMYVPLGDGHLAMMK